MKAIAEKGACITAGNALAIILLIFFCAQVQCRDPYEFEPIFDSLTRPPAAPVLLHPCNDTIYRDYSYPQDIIFEWSYIDGAQYYFLEYTTDSAFIYPAPEQEQVSLSCCTLSIMPPPPMEKKFFYWRVRAYSRLWWWYTDWSEIWHFTFVKS